MVSVWRSRWAAVGAAVAVALGGGGIGFVSADLGTGDRPVYVSLPEPCRIVDTRPAPNNVGITPGKIGNGEANAITIQITGANGNCTGDLAIPADAVAVALNLTAVNPSTASNFRMYPADGDFPTTSNLNFSPERSPVANKVDVGLSSDGKVKLSNAQGTADAAIDVFGYYIGHNHDDRYYTQSEIDTTVGALELDVARVSPARIVWVAQDGTGDFELLSEALASITDNAEDNRYLIRIAPGVYTETSMVTAKPYVDIRGSGLGATVITCACGDASSPSLAATLSVGSEIEVRDLAVTNTSTLANGTAIATAGGAPLFNRVLAQATALTNTTAIYNSSGSKARFSDSVAVALDGSNATAITNAGAGTNPIFVDVEAQATTTGSNAYGVVNVTFAEPIFRGLTVTALGATSDNIGVYNLSNANPIVRDSSIQGDDRSIANDGGATVRVAGSQLDGAVAGTSTFFCVASYTETFTELDQECVPIP